MSNIIAPTTMYSFDSVKNVETQENLFLTSGRLQHMHPQVKGLWLTFIPKDEVEVGRKAADFNVTTLEQEDGARFNTGKKNSTSDLSKDNMMLRLREMLDKEWEKVEAIEWWMAQRNKHQAEEEVEARVRQEIERESPEQAMEEEAAEKKRKQAEGREVKDCAKEYAPGEEKSCWRCLTSKMPCLWSESREARSCLRCRRLQQKCWIPEHDLRKDQTVKVPTVCEKKVKKRVRWALDLELECRKTETGRIGEEVWGSEFDCQRTEMNRKTKKVRWAADVLSSEDRGKHMDEAKMKRVRWADNVALRKPEHAKVSHLDEGIVRLEKISTKLEKLEQVRVRVTKPESENMRAEIDGRQLKKVRWEDDVMLQGPRPSNGFDLGDTITQVENIVVKLDEIIRKKMKRIEDLEVEVTELDAEEGMVEDKREIEEERERPHKKRRRA